MEPLMGGENKGFLTRDEELQFKSMITRLHTLCKVPSSSRKSSSAVDQWTSGLTSICVQYASEQNVRMMIDAEQSYFQPAIHRYVRTPGLLL
jgi:hypothetical protein